MKMAPKNLLKLLLDGVSALGGALFTVLCFFFLGFWDGLTLITVLILVVVTWHVRASESSLRAEIQKIEKKISVEKGRLEVLEKANGGSSGSPSSVSNEVGEKGKGGVKERHPKGSSSSTKGGEEGTSASSKKDQ